LNTPDGILIRPFVPADRQGVIDVILPIQREEFGIAITAEDQPDLDAIPAFYQSGKGAFLVAEDRGRIVGTIGMKDIGSDEGALRKMFVAAAHRGAASGTGLAARLLEALLELAGARGIRRVYLGTTDKFVAAHRFYEKHGFSPCPPETLPGAFPRMAVDTRFYRRDLEG
jgi:N-acetylglutamate synthase-like GNAT family acetyltransferase